MTMLTDRQTVLIISSDPAFSREITARWPRNSTRTSIRTSPSPEFVVLEEGFSGDFGRCDYEIAIVDELSHRSERDRHSNKSEIKALRESLVSAGKPAIIVCDADCSKVSADAGGQVSADVRSEARSDLRPGATADCRDRNAMIELPGNLAGWSRMVGLIGHEILRRCYAESSARRAQKSFAAAEAEATLGRYMVEMRTNVNNALTTVLGNAELLAIEPGLPASVQSQADTIRNMALRLHEVFQRFSSIEKELNVEARESGKKAAAATAGR